MTKEEIEELHAQHALVVGNDRECPHGERQGYCDRCEYEHSILYDMALNALPRLLEERKRLLEALGELAASWQFEMCQPDEQAMEAIAFASSP